VSRYTPSDLDVFDEQERERFLGPLEAVARRAREGDEKAWVKVAPRVAWELLYRKEPELYERLVRGECIAEGALDGLPARGTVVEIAAGAGRLTLELARRRFDTLVAIEPAAAMRELLEQRLRDAGVSGVDVRSGFFDALPLDDDTADAVVSCSAFTSNPAHGGEPGLREMERVTRPGGRIVLVWPTDVDWLEEHGFVYEAVGDDDDPAAVDFGTPDEAVELARIFYPHAVDEIVVRGSAHVPYALLGMNPPRDVAWKTVP
jgi:SAM-dependent methyltransferase